MKMNPTKTSRSSRLSLCCSTFDILLGLLLLISATSSDAAVRYVDSSSASPAPPYTNWASAARVIQDAVDAAAPADEIVVTNGLYATGGRLVGTNLLVNRVAVEKPLTLRSVNGPEVTIIQGYQVPGTTNGDGAIRCVYLADGASLSGFTLTNGATRRWTGGANYYERDYNGGGVWCESANAFVTNCVLTGNSASYGGGGAFYATLNNCTLSGNTASSGSGGGADGGTLNNCVLTGNSASDDGGGAFYATLNNCVLTGNSAYGSGGGASEATLNNCTLMGNSSYGRGGGAFNSTLNNCIVYYNRARLEGANYYAGTFDYCCTTPLPVGQGNIDEEPQLASAWHLSVFSPCRAAGNAAYATGFDIDGEPWANPPSMGCDEYRAGGLTGPLLLSIKAAYTNVAVGFPVELTAWIEGRPTLSVWDFDDGDFALDQPWTTHAWTAPGDYVVALWAFNETHPEGVHTTLTVHVPPQTVHYVAAASGNPLPPYLSWATAATNIQDAVDAATVPGALVLVTNGVYATGGRAVFGTMTNRVTVDKPLTLQSINGPEVTIIQGHQVPGTTNGDGAIRCVYLANGPVLAGFTLTKGATRTNGDYWLDQCGGGVWCQGLSTVVSNCMLTGNSARYEGGGAFDGTLNNCTLTGNQAQYGGGAYNATLNNCTLTGNQAQCGGGASDGTLNNCTLTGNSAGYNGGGASSGPLDDRDMSSHASTLNNCVLTGNSAGYDGGGANGGLLTPNTLNNCVLAGNSAGHSGGGAQGASLNNCTITGNSAASFGGGVSEGYWMGGDVPTRLNNCIVYFNTAPSGANYSVGILNYCCTTPLPADGVGNFSLDPLLASASHLSASSPCRGAGSAAYASGVDIDGEPWGNPPSIGCDEYHPGAVTGPLTVGIAAAFTNVAAGFPVQLAALIDGRTTASAWDIGGGGVVSNQPYASRAWTTPGDYAVVLRAYNESHPEGVSATVTIHVVAPLIHYVSAVSTNPVPPYTTWSTAATNIQDAVDAVAPTAPPGTWVLVTNGVYATGGRWLYGSNRVAVDKPLTLRSTNGPEVTIIQGYQVDGTANGDEAVRCVYLANGASLSGFTITNGATREWSETEAEREQSGGGVCCESVSATVSNCVITGNSAYQRGGGAFRGTLNHCTLTGNWAESRGGGAFGGTLNNCTLTGNSADSGGGAYLGTLKNCIVYFNGATDGPNYDAYGGYSALNYCCTTPMPTNGVGNITNVPLFVDYAGGNLRLESNSPCINAGNNAYAPGSTDLDGNPRIVNGTVDIGAYEFQGSGSVISYAWLQGYGLPTDGSADYADPDHDGQNIWQEWRCQSDPTNALSALRLVSAAPAGTNVTVTWQSVAGVSYFLERSTNLASPFTPLATDLPGQPGTTIYTDTSAAGLAPLFYRVGVGN